MTICTCGEPPHSGHYLWCRALRGQREYRPARPDGIEPEELRAAAKANASLADAVDLALAGDRAALSAVCAELNALAVRS